MRYNYCPKNIEATILKKVPNESKLIYAINILIVASRFLGKAIWFYLISFEKIQTIKNMNKQIAIKIKPL